MKGIVFTEFIEMIESTFGDDVLEETIESSQLKSNGVYTAVGTYNHLEMVELVTQLSLHTKIPIEVLLKAYGNYFFTSLVKTYGTMISHFKSGFDMLKEVETHIHTEVRKIYPDAELPEFETSLDKDTLTMVYRSSRRLSDFAFGLIEGCLKHFNESANIQRELIKSDGSEVKFAIIKA